MRRLPNKLAVTLVLSWVGMACAPDLHSGEDAELIDADADADGDEAEGLSDSEEVGVSDREFDQIVEEMRAAELTGDLQVDVSPWGLVEENQEAQNKDALPAGSLPHNKVQPFAQKANALVTTFQPTLKVSGGCVPFPGVQADGKYNAGLESTGSANGGCGSSTGQVYARQVTVGTNDWHSGARCALIYAWYFPKDGNVISGHRHDWESVVVWLNRCDVNAGVIAVAYSGHGKYKVHRVHKGSPNGFSGKRPRVKYGQTIPLNFQLFPTFDRGGSQPLIDWIYLTPAARKTLNTVSFGKANVPIKDSAWLSNFYKAKFW